LLPHFGHEAQVQKKANCLSVSGHSFRWFAPPRVIAFFSDENASMRLKIAGGKVGALHSHKCLQALGFEKPVCEK
jgi:hypothetical protein